MDAAAELGRNPVSKHQIQPEYGELIFPTHLITSRIGNLTRLIQTLLYVMTIHTYIHTYIARRRERQRDWESCYRIRKRRILRSDAHSPSRRNPCTDGRRTETCVAPRHVDASRDFDFDFICPERAAWGGGGGGGGALPDFFCLFSCSADHERDWPTCKLVFNTSLGLANLL